MAPEEKLAGAGAATGRPSGLIESHMGLVKAIAVKVKRSLTAPVELDDLVGWGNRGLVEAADRFDPNHGVLFSTFAYYRIRGAMYDGLRGIGWYSRGDLGRFRAEERANEYMQSHADRDGAARVAAPNAPSDVGEKLASVAEILSGIATIHMVSMDAATQVADQSLPSPDDRLDTARLTVRVRDAVTKLPAKERRLMELYYFESKNLEAAGAELGLSKSWACRLHARAVDLLRDALAD